MHVRVVIADDHALFAEGLRLYLTIGRSDEMEVVGVAGDGARAVEVAVETAADVVLMDVSMPVLDGLEATRRLLLQRPETRVILVSGFDPDRLREEAAAVGAAAAITKDRVGSDVVDLVLAVAQEPPFAATE